MTGQGNGLADAVKLVQETAVAADRKDIVDCRHEPPGYYYRRDPENKLDLVKAKMPPRQHEFFTVDEFARAVPPFARDTCKPIVFCGRGQVVALLDEESDRQERLSVKLPLSAEFERLVTARATRAVFDQRGFISLLRIDLAGCIEEGVIRTFRNLKFSRDDEGNSVIEHAREQMGRTVKRELAADGADEIPEDITVCVCVYRDMADGVHRMDVECAVQLDIEDGTFCLIPLAGVLESAQQETDAMILKDLREVLGDTATVLCGKPG